MNMKRSSPLRYLIKLSRRGGAALALSVILATISGVLAVLPFYALYRLIALVQAGAPSVELWRWGMVIFQSALAFLAAYLLSMVFSHVAAFRVLRDLRYALARKLLELPLGWFNKRTTGDTRKLFTEDVEKIELFIAHHIPDITRGGVTPATILVFLFFVDWRLALASLIPLTLVPLFLGMVYGNYDKNMGKYYELLSRMNGTIVEYIRGMNVVRAFNRTAASFGGYKASVDEYFRFWKSWTLNIVNAYGGFSTALESGAFFILAIGGPLYLSGIVGLPAFLVALILGPAYVSSLKIVYFMMSSMSMNFQGVARVRAVLEASPLSEPMEPRLPRENRIVFSDVDFAYEDENAVAGLSFEARPGTITALVGPSGAGKTTAALLAARFYDPATGRVAMDGASYPEMGTREIMKRVSICFQESQLFKGTIEENIRMGNHEAGRAEVERAARAARAHGFIMELPDGYETRVSGDRSLSGGQIQRIAIARAILKDSPVVILDEATSYADPENERLIQEALNELLRDRSVVVVAHRLKTLKKVDRILVFDGGRIVESGSFDELVAKGGTFSRLWAGASAALEWNVAKFRAGAPAEEGILR